MGFLLGDKKGKQILEDIIKVVGCVNQAVTNFLQFCNDPNRPKTLKDSLEKIEHDSDRIAGGIFRALKKITVIELPCPLESTDLRELTDHLDSIIDCLWGAEKRIFFIYHPSEITTGDKLPEIVEAKEIIEKMIKEMGGTKEEELSKIAEIIKEMFEILANVLRCLKDLSKMKETIRTEIGKIHDKENEVDELAERAENRWFLAAIVDPRKTPFLYAWTEVYKRLDWAANRCLDVADILDSLSSE